MGAEVHALMLDVAFGSATFSARGDSKDVMLAFDAFKDRHLAEVDGLKAELKAERKERESLELRLTIPRLGGGSSGDVGDLVAERKAMASFAAATRPS